MHGLQPLQPPKIHFLIQCCVLSGHSSEVTFFTGVALFSFDFSISWSHCCCHFQQQNHGLQQNDIVVSFFCTFHASAPKIRISSEPPCHSTRPLACHLRHKRITIETFLAKESQIGQFQLQDFTENIYEKKISAQIYKTPKFTENIYMTKATQNKGAKLSYQKRLYEVWCKGNPYLPKPATIRAGDALFDG